MYMSSELVIACVLIPVSAIGLIWIRVKSKNIRSFVEVEASIQKLDTKLAHSEGFAKQKNIDVEYTYNYGGSEYKSTTVNLLSPGNGATWTDHLALHDHLKKIRKEGKKLKVWINPNNPTESTIVKDIFSSTLWFFNISGFLGVVSLFVYFIKDTT